MNAKHTPGPWTSLSADMAGTEGIQIRDAQKYAVATLTGPWTLEQEQANARLIAAAPELLEIARAYRNLLKTMAHTDGEAATYHHIESVITKATGGA